MKRLLHIILSLFALSIPSSLSAQNRFIFQEGLYLEVPYTYGREAIYTDEFLWNFYNKYTKAPTAGKPLAFNGNGSTWTAVSADTSGFFRPRSGNGGNLNSPANPPGPGRIALNSQQSATRARQQYRGPRPSYLYLNYTSDKARAAILNIKGNSAVLVNGELHAGDPYRMGWLQIPIQLQKGSNDFYVRGAYVSAKLEFPKKDVQFADQDLTLPDIVEGRNNSELQLGIVLINNSNKALQGLSIESNVQGKKIRSNLPNIPAKSSRKVAVRIDAGAVHHAGEVPAQLVLRKGSKMLDQGSVMLRSLPPNVPYRVTFTSSIDNSLQYYAVNPAEGGEKPGQALFFSVHGAGVEALGQAQAYSAKDWGTLIAPTNRRPRGFNWEDWGRLDALEVLQLAKQSLQPDSQKVYLTGHSMGGHGTWFLGATYPDKWAAIAPCAGYPTLKGYGSADGLIPEKASTTLEQVLLRSSNQSDVIAYSSNYKNLGVYILHGDADRTVSVEYARQMREILGKFHPDFNYYEYPGGSHWYSNESVDWKPLFDYFRWHKIKSDSVVTHIDFKTANPGISASYHWASINQQDTPLEYSHLQASRDLANGLITAKTTNIQSMAFDISIFPLGQPIKFQVDSLSKLSYANSAQAIKVLFLTKKDNGWQFADPPNKAHKGPHRNGTFKEAFNQRMLYVYGTGGSSEENAWAIEKARYDAESWYYRGNGAFDIISDKEFDIEQHGMRNIILIGNAQSNGVWKKLLNDCPISVKPGVLSVGGRETKGLDIGGYFQWRRSDNDSLSVGVITGTGLAGMRAAGANQYFAGASGFPDYMFFNSSMLKDGAAGVIDAGFYTNQWEIK